MSATVKKVKKTVSKVSTPDDDNVPCEDEPPLCDNELTICDNNLTFCVDKLTDECAINSNESEYVTMDECECEDEKKIEIPSLSIKPDEDDDDEKVNAEEEDDDDENITTEPKRPIDLSLNKTAKQSKATKCKFYESDDAIISQIFSQTITSAGVTPTDECDNFVFEKVASDNDSSNMTTTVDVCNGVNGSSSAQFQASDELSFECTVTSIDKQFISPSLSQKQQPSIIVDSYEDYSTTGEPCYVEPITPKEVKSYFDTTIVPEDENVSSHDSVVSPAPSPSPTEYDLPIQLTDIEVYKSLSTDDQSLTRNGNVVDITKDIYVDTSLVTSGSDETGNSFDKDEFDVNDDELNDPLNTSSTAVEQHIEISEMVSTQTMTTSSSTTSSSLALENAEHETLVKLAGTTEKKEKKKKSKGDAETGEKRKKSKRSKKSDPEKENISVLVNKNNKAQTVSNVLLKSNSDVTPLKSDHQPDAFGPLKIRRTISSCLPLHEDDLSNIDVKSLKKIYLLGSKPLEKITENIPRKTPVRLFRSASVKHLCRSFGDLSTLRDDEGRDFNTNSNRQVRNESLLRAKSVADLRKCEQNPVHTGVSVKELRDSYCNLVGLIETHIERNNKVNVNRVTFRIKQFDMKSSFSKFDALQKKNILHVRSSDSSKAQEKFNGNMDSANEKICRACEKVVFQMEEIKAERAIWHKNCFRCKECSKQLNVDTYQSNDGILYCKPHFKTLFSPKAVEETEPVKPRRHELIIRENQPQELPPDVVRSSDRADLGLEELQSLNVRQKFQVFEHGGEKQTEETSKSSSREVKRSQSILSKLAKFHAKGMNIGVDDEINGIPLEASSEESDNEENGEDEDGDEDLIRARKVQKERPMSFKEMNEMKTKFEQGHMMTKEERREERKQEIQNIRSRLFMGKQAKMKEVYQQAVADSEQGVVAANKKPDIDIGNKAKSIKEKFEKGEAYHRDEENGDENTKQLNDEEQAVFEQGLGRKSRSLFLEMDASAPKHHSSINISPRTPEVRKNPQLFTAPQDVVKSADKTEEVQVETAEISSKFKFFEGYKPEEKKRKEFRITPPRDGVEKSSSPDRELYRDPDVVRADETNIDDPTVAAESHTASKMLSIFRQLEDKKAHESRQAGPKPLKRFTPPLDDGRRVVYDGNESDNVTNSEDEDDESESDEEDEESDEGGNPNGDYIRSSDKFDDEFLKQAQSAERAKQLRAKFERWESNEIKREQNNSSINLYDNSEDSQVESAKSIRAKFESMKNTAGSQEQRDKIRVNRFV